MVNQELQYQVLKLLEENPDLTQRQIAEKLGVSLGKTHYLIKSLTDAGTQLWPHSPAMPLGPLTSCLLTTKPPPQPVPKITPKALLTSAAAP